MIVEGADRIAYARLLTLRGALRLEIIGLKRRGRSVYSILKGMGFSGNKAKVLSQVNELIAEAQEYGLSDEWVKKLNPAAREK